MAFEGINWGLAAPVNVAGAFQDGWQRGQDMRKEADTRNALAAYATNPTMQSANALIAVDPRLGMQARTQQIEQDKAARLQAVTARAVQGDHSALTEIAGLDPDMWKRLNDQHREQIKQATGFMGQAVLDVSRLPEDQRPAAWAHYVQQAEASGMDIPTQYERYSPEALNAAAAEAGTTEKLIKMFEPDYRAVPQGGYLENVNPLSRTTPIESGPATGAPQPGHVEGGYRFKGGDAGDPANWEAAGGPTQHASGTFRP